MSDALSVDELLDRYGTTYAREAGITLRDKPAPLYQLLVLTTLLSVRISARIAVAAARELFHAGWRTPRAMVASTWQQRVDALGRGHYVRYDESTATALGDSAQCVLDVYHGDLRRIRPQSDVDIPRLREALRGFPRIGETGAHIFCREAQVVWPRLRPYFDRRALFAARQFGLPTDPDELAGSVATAEVGRLAAGLVRAALDRKR
ncbi:MAG TPA: endonuclease [Pseudonocardiaceae bacterium]